MIYFWNINIVNFLLLKFNFLIYIITLFLYQFNFAIYCFWIINFYFLIINDNICNFIFYFGSGLDYNIWILTSFASFSRIIGLFLIFIFKLAKCIYIYIFFNNFFKWRKAIFCIKIFFINCCYYFSKKFNIQNRIYITWSLNND